ncbi:zinc ribbon domain-containing protein [Pseudalkalibacillus hwajinpoensis]|uniref:Zinc ribbon domain-containing protein n=1 Tax=Guptibacillus hwajinpoensis TaxID=208199 RepID=A0A4V5PZP4_9BACL|nr:zinc ribbon domain-containing protein [Pseudalkalibacillus hwajinpoensis]TKD70918.1 zinc ribbon domain-containing protein [Pseudalkalibacillus hwajinpoensis]
MYCTTCGNEVPFGDNYCPNDGTFQQHDLQQHVTSGATPKFCSDCGTSNTGEHLYCIQCGSFQLTLIPFKFERTKEKVSAPSQALPDLSGINKKMALLCALLAFLMVGIASFIIAESFQNQAVSIQEVIAEYARVGQDGILYDFYDYGDSNLPTDPYTGTTDYWMATHLLNSEVSFDSTYDDETYKGGVHLESGYLILLLIPIFALLLSGYLYGRRNSLNTQQYWISSLLIGAVYGGLTAIVAIFAGFSFSGEIADDWFNTSLAIENNYPFVKAFFAAFFIGTVISFIGCLLGSGTLKSLTSSPLKEGVRTITIGIAASIVVMMVVFYGFIIDDLRLLGVEDIPTSVFVFIIAQLGFLLWNVLNLSSLSLNMSGFGENVQIDFSTLAGMKVIPTVTDQDLTMLLNNAQDLRFYMLLGLLLPITLFVWAGYRMQQEDAVRIHRIAMFGFVYALLMSLLVAGTNTGINFYSSPLTDSFIEMEDLPTLFYGFSTIGTFFKCFIFSTLFAIAGAYWKKQRNRGQVRT